MQDLQFQSPGLGTTVSIHLRVSFVKLNATEVNESNGKQYWEDQPEIRIKYMSDHISNNKRRERLANIPK